MENNNENNRTISEISIFSQQLITFLGEKEVSEEITYESMSDLIGLSITSPKGRSYLYTATKRLLNDEQIVFGTIRGVGIKRLSDTEIVNTTGKRFLKSVRQKNRVATRKNTSVDYENLSAEDKINQQTTNTILSLMGHVTNRKSIKLIEKGVDEKKKQINQKETLKMLRKPLLEGDE